MNRRIVAVTLFSIACVGIMAIFFLHETAVKNVPLRVTGPVLFFGDSLVEGVGATAGHNLPALLTQSIGEPVLNYGVAGDTTRQGLARLPSARAEKPKLVLVLLGGNDFLQKTPRAETFANLEKIVTSFQADGAAVVLIGVRSGLIGGGADDEYEALAEKTGAFYIEDVLKGVFGDASLMSDAVHPNDQGYERIAGRITEEIIPLLKSR